MKAERRICSPMVNTSLRHLNGLQRSAAFWLHFFLYFERRISPDGKLREWLRQNARLSAWLLIPAVLVMSVVSLVLWQLASWLTMLTSIAGKLVVLPILILMASVVIRVSVSA